MVRLALNPELQSQTHDGAWVPLSLGFMQGNRMRRRKRDAGNELGAKKCSCTRGPLPCGYVIALKGNIAGTVKWKDVQIVQQRESPQLSISIGFLIGLDFLSSLLTVMVDWIIGTGSLTITI